MRFPSQKGILIILLAIFLVVCIPVITNLISDDVKTWCLNTFGEGYTRYLYVPFVLGCIAMLFLTTDVEKWFKLGSASSTPQRYNIPPGPKSRKVLDQAKAEVGNAEPGEALRLLSDLRLPTLSNEIDLLAARLADYQRTRRLNVEAHDTENRALNRINRDVIALITALQNELATSTGNYDTIREYLKKRYDNRLEQKLAKRQPVNLRRLVNKDVIPEDFHAAFVSYSSDEISGAMLQTFHEAQGRLLLVGAPGAGKTTLMLQLVLELLDSEADALPVLLNLATWSNEFITLEAWLKKILPVETGTSERYAVEMLEQNNLILLFDGFDEIREEDRLSCLEAINRYASDGRPYVISSRKQEFKDVKKGVVVHLPVEVCPLSFDQLKAELLRLRNDPDQPERSATLLLDAIEKDPLLQEAVQIPFYFNALQILFNEGVGLSEMQFKADSVEGRQVEIKECFAEYELKASVKHQFSQKDTQHWLAFLATRMTKRNLVVFELRDLQYDWKESKWPIIDRVIIGIVGGLVNGLYGGLVVWLVVGLLNGLVVGLGFGLIGTLLAGLLTEMDRHPSTKSIGWSQKGLIEAFKDKMVSVLFVLVFGGLIAMLIGVLIGVQVGLLSGVVFGVLYGVLVGVLVGGLVGLPFIRTKDSIVWSQKGLIEAFKDGLSNGLVVGLVVGLGVGLVHGLFSGLAVVLVIGLNNMLENYTYVLQITSPYHRFNASKKAFLFSILQHKHLCYLLRKRNLLPPDLPQFLNEMSLRHILEFDGDPKTGTGGGSWRFRHRILQEYFAEKWVEGN